MTSRPFLDGPLCTGAPRCQRRSCSLRCACSTLTPPTPRHGQPGSSNGHPRLKCHQRGHLACPSTAPRARQFGCLQNNHRSRCRRPLPFVGCRSLSGTSLASTFVGPAQQRSRRITRRNMPLAVASVVPTTRNPARANIDFVPTNAMVRSIRPGGSTGYASTAGAPCDAA